MGMRMIGSVSEYTRSLKLSARWQMKKESENYTQKSDAASGEFEVYREQLEKIREDNASGKSAIYQKLGCGKELTAEELEYLKEHDMVSYQKYKELQAKRESYEKELKRCKTKEDVERLKTTRFAECFASANAIANNPNIPKAQKMSLLMHENVKMKAIEELTQKFKNSSMYGKLPTDAEKLQEEEERLDKLRGDRDTEKETSSTEEKKEDDFHNDLPEKGKEEINAGNSLPENGEGGKKAEVSAKEETETGSAKEDIIRTAAETDARTALHSYGRQAYQREVSYQPEQERIFKHKRG